MSFDEISDEDDRDYFKLLPTSFVLGRDQIDDLREAGRRLLREDPTFQKLLEALK